MTSRYGMLLALSFLLCGGCEKEGIGIRSEFQPYVDRFVEEGAMRGYTIDFSQSPISIRYQRVEDDTRHGSCRGNHTIEINRDAWADMSDNEREGLIFHELGHCTLGRQAHRNDLFANGEWKSRMRGDPLPKGRSQVINYSGVRRTYYIDELFEVDMGTPEWATYTANYTDVPMAAKEVIVERRSVPETFSEVFRHLKATNYELEVEVRHDLSLAFQGVQWGGALIENSYLLVMDFRNRVRVESGKELMGALYDRLAVPLNPGFDKLTIRKKEDSFEIFINEEFFYWFDFEEEPDRVFAAIKNEGSPRYKNLSICTIP